MQKAIDVVKPVCPNQHQHYQIRRWIRSLPSLGFMDGPATILVIPNWGEPCSTRIITDGVDPKPDIDEILASIDIGASLLTAVEFGKPWRGISMRTAAQGLAAFQKAMRRA